MRCPLVHATEDEWYKAAYHDKPAGLAANYFDYPTGTNSVPGRDIKETTDPGNNANWSDSNYLLGSPYYRTLVGEFELSAGPYGTFDQGDNVYEWNETVLFDSYRGLRGGSFYYFSSDMKASARYIDDPAIGTSSVGFRVASIAAEEPATILLAVVALIALPTRRRKSVPHNRV